MKMSLNVVCDGYKKRSGEHAVYIFIRRAGKQLRINTGLLCSERFSGREFPRSDRNAKVKTSRLGGIILALERYELEHPDCSNKELKNFAQSMVLGVEPRTMVLAEYIAEFASLKGNSGTRGLYMSTAKKVAAYDAAAELSLVNADWLTKFYNHLRETMSINGAAIHLRNIRAVFNWAIDNELTEKYPFRRFKIPQERTRKRSLTVEQLITLRDYPVEEWQREYRDMFMLSFYLIGMNIGDMLMLKKLTDGRCVYHRRKTGRLYDIEVQPEAKEIIDRYRGKGQLLSPLDRYKDYHDYMHHMNDGLKKIGESRVVPDRLGKRRKVEYEPLFPDISSYWARHTWATIAARLDIPKETIGKALGHSDFESSTTDIYIDFDMRKVDEANRKVLDFLKKQAADNSTA